MRLKIRLFGPFEATWEESPEKDLVWPRKQTETLFKIFLSSQGRIFSQDQLIEALFKDLDYESAIKNLHKRISELRKTLDPGRKPNEKSSFIESTAQGSYRLSDDGPLWIDTKIFQDEVEKALKLESEDELPRAIEHLNRALELYRGPFLSENLYDEWSQEPRQALRDIFVESLLALARCHLALGQYAGAIAASERALKEAPGEEEIYQSLMKAHYFAGERAKALAIYESRKRQFAEQ